MHCRYRYMWLKSCARNFFNVFICIFFYIQLMCQQQVNTSYIITNSSVKIHMGWARPHIFCCPKGHLFVSKFLGLFCRHELIFLSQGFILTQTCVKILNLLSLNITFVFRIKLTVPAFEVLFTQKSPLKKSTT